MLWVTLQKTNFNKEFTRTHKLTLSEYHMAINLSTQCQSESIWKTHNSFKMIRRPVFLKEPLYTRNKLQVSACMWDASCMLPREGWFFVCFSLCMYFIERLKCFDNTGSQCGHGKNTSSQYGHSITAYWNKDCFFPSK